MPAFAEGMAGGFPAPPVAALPAGWERQLVATRALVSAFAIVRPALVVAPPADATSAGRGWPSPRTWEMTACLVAAARAADASADALSALVRGAVGDGAGAEFLAWSAELDLPDPEAVLADPSSFVLPEQGDQRLCRVVLGGGRRAGRQHRRTLVRRLEGARDGGGAGARRGRRRRPAAGSATGRRGPAPRRRARRSSRCCATPGCCSSEPPR
ncbi:MAG: hypothetical protein R2749_18915 [Acidimicrobiales bacterium]